MDPEATIVTIPGLNALPLECLFDYGYVTGTLRPAVDAALRASMIHTLMSGDEYEAVLTAAFHQAWEAAVDDRFLM